MRNADRIEWLAGRFVRGSMSLAERVYTHIDRQWFSTLSAFGKAFFVITSSTIYTEVKSKRTRSKCHERVISIGHRKTPELVTSQMIIVFCNFEKTCLFQLLLLQLFSTIREIKSKSNLVRWNVPRKLVLVENDFSKNALKTSSCLSFYCRALSAVNIRTSHPNAILQI